MARILLLSDLHFEYDYINPLFERRWGLDDCDVAVLAGDIHTKFAGLEWALKAFDCPVIYVPGNHEYWKRNLYRHGPELVDKAEGTHVNVLINRTVYIAGVRFFGTTGWPDYSSWSDPYAAANAAAMGKKMYQSGDRDYAKITGKGYSNLKPSDVIGQSSKAKAWLFSELSKPSELPKVVVTHHPPTLLSGINPAGPRDILDASDTNAWESVVEASGAKYWLHGHVHRNRRNKIGDTEVISNPMGGAKADGVPSNPDFMSNFILEV